MGHNNKKKNKMRNKKNKHNKQISHSDEGDRTECVEEEAKSIPDNDMNVSKSSEKRPHDDDDSDHEEDKPRKKKKKKQPMASDTPDKKGKKSIRQMKREKFVERQAAAQASAKDQLKNQCLSYLSQWKHDKQNWKFMKAKQVWLYKNKFSSTLVPDSSWQLLLDYFDSAQGNIRKMLLDDANKIIKQMDEWTESQSDKQADANEEETNDNDDSENTPTNVKPDEIVYKRARDLIQCLQE